MLALHGKLAGKSTLLPVALKSVHQKCSAACSFSAVARQHIYIYTAAHSRSSTEPGQHSSTRSHTVFCQPNLHIDSSARQLSSTPSSTQQLPHSITRQHTAHPHSSTVTQWRSSSPTTYPQPHTHTAAQKLSSTHSHSSKVTPQRLTCLPCSTLTMRVTQQHRSSVAHTHTAAG